MIPSIPSARYPAKRGRTWKKEEWSDQRNGRRPMMLRSCARPNHITLGSSVDPSLQSFDQMPIHVSQLRTGIKPSKRVH
ncbi:hypothetical protein HNY73_003937 [Argiope bruennichi]|uniref:Uncharacterized protein n=1 Tax=Argiope bruennichi TaxID=94029 RepID=A0A8T0FMA0_ARGBR|nr:hypothetical protein HNY73_003937 [Argiope bruennichi]